MSDCADQFARRIWSVVEQIPPGKVCSYGQAANLAGFPGYARHVARALRAAPPTLKLPWHRVVAANGRIAPKVGSETRRQQIDRLNREGVLIRNGRVNMQSCVWRGGLDALLWRVIDE